MDWDGGRVRVFLWGIGVCTSVVTVCWGVYKCRSGVMGCVFLWGVGGGLQVFQWCAGMWTSVPMVCWGVCCTGLLTSTKMGC